jgi:UDP:flavonoid glycosyltransferase YjiC (YdhE family)
LLPQILRSLATLDITVIAATAGADVPDALPANACIAKYLPGEEAARRARLVICNGGSPTSQQALAAGVPVIGIASNLDQFLNMDTIVRVEAGAIMRADRFSGPILSSLVTKILAETGHAAAAKKVADIIGRYDGASRFVATVRSMLKT